MKYLLIISCLLFTAVGWSEDVSLNDLIVKDGLYYKKSKDLPFTGNVTGQQQGKIIQGKRDDLWIWYYDNGQFQYKLSLIHI